MKKVIALASVIFALSLAFPEKLSVTDEEQEKGLEQFDDEFDSLFDAGDEGDIEVEQSDATAHSDEKNAQVVVAANPYKIPLRFSGHLDSNLGFFGTRNAATESAGASTKPSAYFDLANYLYFMSRIDKTIAVRGKLMAHFPPGSTNVMSLSELYMDYLMFDRIYLTAGKKGTTWGYTRLFSGEDAYRMYSDTSYDRLSEAEKDEMRKKMEAQGFLFTNIVADSSRSASALLRIPFDAGVISGGTLSGMVLYSGSKNEPEFDDLSLAGSLEFTVFHQAINIFGRKDSKVTLSNGTEFLSYTAGIETKRTVFGSDVYFQAIGKRSVEGNLPGKFVFTGGIYKWWDEKDPGFGFNMELQDTYNKDLDVSALRMYTDVGLKRLGKSKSMKLALQWQHTIRAEDVSDKEGVVTLAFIKSGLFPHADWKNAISMRYAPNNGNYHKNPYQMRLGSTVTIAIDY